MIVLSGGEIVKYTNITFTDNKYDMECGHPALILLPTSENEETAHCLYMTSDESRAMEDSEKYRELKSKHTKFKSYVNLDQILKKVNNKDILSDSIEQDVFINILEEFYKFQISKEKQNPEFMEIKSKIETFLLILKNKHSFGIKDVVSRNDLERIDKIKKKNKNTNEDKIKLFNYGWKVIHDGESENDLIFNNDKDKKYFSVLLQLYNKVISINLEKIDLSNLNNELRNIYYDFRSRHYLINADTLFADLNDLIYILEDRKDTLTNFIILEEQRKQQKVKNNLEKQERKKLKKENERRQKIAIKAEKSYNVALSKYGNFDGFDK